jgi:hypothetical protein
MKSHHLTLKRNLRNPKYEYIINSNFTDCHYSFGFVTENDFETYLFICVNCASDPRYLVTTLIKKNTNKFISQDTYRTLTITMQ